MKKLTLAITLASLIGAATMTTAQAMPAGLSAHLGDAAVGLNMVDKTQYVFGGRRYCWYDDGWSGSGWYWCGYAFRRGLGWGGGSGWHGWSGGGRRGGGVHVGGQRSGGARIGAQRSGGARSGAAAVHSGGGRAFSGGHARSGGGGHAGRAGGAGRGAGGAKPHH
jgi:hypothetical protein